MEIEGDAAELASVDRTGRRCRTPV